MKTPEMTLRSIILAILLTILLAISNTYLALKLGILTSASIPAAILSMGLLRFFKNSTILENNLVQTAASAGEAIAGGIVYTLPALIIIQYWQHFDYLSSFIIALSAGILGILFSIPLREILVHDSALMFPEGRAVAEILKFSHQRIDGMYNILYGGIISAIFEFLQTGLKVIASNWNFGFIIKKTVFGFGLGFSAVMLGAGYLIGYEMTISIFVGAIIAWLLVLPIISHLYIELFAQHLPINQMINILWDTKIRYFGIGAMLFAGVWVFIKLSKPLLQNIITFFSDLIKSKQYKDNKSNYQSIEHDIPTSIILFGIILISIILFISFYYIFPLNNLLSGNVSLIFAIIFYILIIGFLFTIITAYFSGMVGVTASPGSAVVIAGILLTASLIKIALPFLQNIISSNFIYKAEALTIVIGAILTGIAAIANDNIQDLKIGQLIGATPWKQQVMLLLGVIVSAAIIPLIMQLLFNVYGIAGIVSHIGMNINKTLPAPTAAVMAAITQGVFQHNVAWLMIISGALTMAVIVILNKICILQKYFKISILGVAIGMYLPISSSFPLFIGGILSILIKKNLQKSLLFSEQDKVYRLQNGVLIACGLVTGAALMDVFLAIPFSLLHSADALSIVSSSWDQYGIILAILSIMIFFIWLNRRVCN